MVDNNEAFIRQYIRELKMFYKEILTSVSVLAVCFIAWMATGGGCWPIWVFVALAIKLLMRAISIGRISIWEVGCFGKWLSFLRPEWEEQQFQKIISCDELNVSKKSDCRYSNYPKYDSSTITASEIDAQNSKKKSTGDKNFRKDDVPSNIKQEENI
ncbi:MAG: hypothetical protein LBD36_00595 [Holosporales bacterium]|jgi:hypothetical protein|nr:hypothetical protein [Holosporales bacterium]